MTYSPEILEAIAEDERHRECVSALDCKLSAKHFVTSAIEYECSRVQMRRPILAALIESAMHVSIASEGLIRIGKLHDCNDPRCPSQHHIGPQIARETMVALEPKENA